MDALSERTSVKGSGKYSAGQVVDGRTDWQLLRGSLNHEN